MVKKEWDKSCNHLGLFWWIYQSNLFLFKESVEYQEQRFLTSFWLAELFLGNKLTNRNLVKSLFKKLSYTITSCYENEYAERRGCSRIRPCVRRNLDKKMTLWRTLEIAKNLFRLENRLESSVKSSECRALLLNNHWYEEKIFISQK